MDDSPSHPDYAHGMSTRLQVVVDENDLHRYREAARNEGMRLSEWVRRQLRAAVRDAPKKRAEQKLKALRVASSHSFPIAGIDQLLAEIEEGRNTR